MVIGFHLRAAAPRMAGHVGGDAVVGVGGHPLVADAALWRADLPETADGGDASSLEDGDAVLGQAGEEVGRQGCGIAAGGGWDFCIARLRAAAVGFNGDALGGQGGLRPPGRRGGPGCTGCRRRGPGHRGSRSARLCRSGAPALAMASRLALERSSPVTSLRLPVANR